jgi:hypothetical protein
MWKVVNARMGGNDTEIITQKPDAE